MRNEELTYVVSLEQMVLNYKVSDHKVIFGSLTISPYIINALQKRENFFVPLCVDILTSTLYIYIPAIFIVRVDMFDSSCAMMSCFSSSIFNLTSVSASGSLSTLESAFFTGGLETKSNYFYWNMSSST